MSTSAKRVRRLVGGILLNLAAIGGVLCIISVIAAFFFNVTLIMFKTGSMDPAIPAGSLAVVRQIPASEIQIGDVVTVERSHQLPVTHRVTSISDAPGAADGSRVITMRGDANASDDVGAYTVQQVRIVLASFPGLAVVIVTLSNPIVLGCVTLGAAGLVTWAFWPRGNRNHKNPKRGVHDAAKTGVVLVTLPALLALSFADPTPARAAETETVVHGTFITLTAIGDMHLMLNLLVGQPVPWQVGVQAAPPTESTIYIGISAEGDLAVPGGLQVKIRTCTARWVAGVCPGVESLWLPQQDLASAIVPVTAFGARQLGSMPSNEQRWLLLDATLPSGTSPGAFATVFIHAWGAGDDVAIGTGGQNVTVVTRATASISATGVDLGLPIFLALIAIGGGLGIAELSRRRGKKLGREP